MPFLSFSIFKLFLYYIVICFVSSLFALTEDVAIASVDGGVDEMLAPLLAIVFGFDVDVLPIICSRPFIGYVVFVHFTLLHIL